MNKKRARKGLPPLEPLYTVEDATASLGNFVSLGYDRPLPVAPGVTLTFPRRRPYPGLGHHGTGYRRR